MARVEHRMRIRLLHVLVIASGFMSACSATPKSQPASAVSASPTHVATSSVTATAGVVANAAPPAEMAAPVIPPEAQQRFAAAMQLVSAGNHTEAVTRLETLANDYPTLAVPLINAGLLYLKASQYDAAERTLKRAVERDPQSPIANTYFGIAARNLGKFKDAEAAYHIALNSDDNYALAHLNLGILYDLYLQQPEQALGQYERYQQLLPAPDAKVAGWIKELKARLGAKSKAPATDTHASGDKP